MPWITSPSRLIILLILLLAMTPAAAAVPTEVSVELGGRKAVVPGLQENGRTYISLRGVAAALDGRVEDDGKSIVRLVTAGGTVVFAAELPSLAQVNGTMVSLPDRVLRQENDLYVPAEAARRLFEPLEVTEVAPEPLAGAIPVRVGMTGNSGELRLVLEAPAALRPDLSRKGGDLLVRFGKNMRLAPPYARRTFGAGLLEEVVFEQEDVRTVLRLVPGPGFRTASLERGDGDRRVEVVLRGDARRRVSSRGEIGTMEDTGVRMVVIDPGHGGTEEGAEGPDGILEKDVTLQVARRLRAELQARGFEVELTRTVDRDLSLDERAAIANEHRADLFISLHANASPRPAARGAETYYLAREATDDAARTTAALENDAARRGARDDPEGLDLVLWDLAQVEYLEESAALAETIQRELNAALDLADRGVRQAPFRVLMGATMPAVLVEMGFLSNTGEARLLNDPRHQDRLAQTIARAVETFRSSYERRLGMDPVGAGSRER